MNDKFEYSHGWDSFEPVQGHGVSLTHQRQFFSNVFMMYIRNAIEDQIQHDK